jgi:protein phosphatase 4 regulatory subunit 3
MALQVPLANDKKRVKVYELRDNDWFDRGTGFCTGQIINVSTFLTSWRGSNSLLRDGALACLFAHNLSFTLILDFDRKSHVSMSSPKINQRGCCWRRRLSRTMDIRNSKVRCQTPQCIRDTILNSVADTLIVWTETNGTDMALSFQEADGCAVIW